MSVHRRWQGRMALAVLAVVMISLLAAVPASAAVTLSTRFPGITVKPGEKLSIFLDVRNDGPAGIVDLAVVDAPSGWEKPALRGGGYAVSQVFVGTGKEESVNLEMTVPQNANEQAYKVTLRAAGPSGTSTLPLDLRVAKTATSRASLTTQFPAIQGTAGSSYTFRVDLKNDSDQKQMFVLQAPEPPKGWEIQFKPAYESKRITSVPVDANSSQGIDVEIKVPDEAAAGKFKVPVGTSSTAGLQAKIDLELEVLGRYEVNLTTPSGRLSAEAVAGRSNPVTLTVVNKGSSPLANLTLAASAPPNWSVTFSPDKLDVLEPNQSRQVEATIKPDTRAIAGDYLVSMSTRTADGSASKRAEFRVAVQTSTAWGIVGVVIVLAVVGAVAWVFKTYGRR